MTDNEQATLSKSNATDLAVTKAFRRAGYGTVTPRVDVQTYGRWLAEGRKVKAGEKSLKVGPLRLFHLLQTQEFTPSTEGVVQLKDAKKAKKAATETAPTLGL